MRCIAHIDLDCFYAQVEAVRLGVNCRDIPFVLSQWGNMIAVNYPARAQGVRRMDSVDEVKEKCPNAYIACVATYRVGESEYRYHPNPNKQTHKVSLEPYRDASRRIFAILRSEPNTKVEKAGIDEAFLDVTEAARRELEVMRAAHPETAAPLDPVANVLEHSTKLIEDRREEMEKWFAERGSSLEAAYDGPMRQLKRGVVHGGCSGSRAFSVSSGCTPEEAVEQYENSLLLCAASHVVKRLRQRVYDELHYDCSAGIAHNRLLAKCISATHKPNQQTLLLPDRASSALFALQFERLRGFGGKFGQAVREVCGGAELCSEAWLVPLPQLFQLDHTHYHSTEDGEAMRVPLTRAKRSRTASEGASGDHVARLNSMFGYFRLRGFDDDELSGRVMVKSLMACKNFSPPTEDVEGMRKWIIVLSGELAARHEDLLREYAYRGHNLNVKLGCGGLYNLAGVGTRTTRLPELVTAELLLSLALSEVQDILSCRDSSTPAAVNSVTLTIGDLGPTTHAAQRTLASFFPTATSPVASVKQEGGSVEIVELSSGTSREGSSASVVVWEDADGSATNKPGEVVLEVGDDLAEVLRSTSSCIIVDTEGGTPTTTTSGCC